jgi:hypothetical protein
MTTEGKARAMGHQSTEIRAERKNKSNGTEIALRCVAAATAARRPYHLSYAPK